MIIFQYVHNFSIFISCTHKCALTFSHMYTHGWESVQLMKNIHSWSINQCPSAGRRPLVLLPTKLCPISSFGNIELTFLLCSILRFISRRSLWLAIRNVYADYPPHTNIRHYLLKDFLRFPFHIQMSEARNGEVSARGRVSYWQTVCKETSRKSEESSTTTTT